MAAPRKRSNPADELATHQSVPNVLRLTDHRAPGRATTSQKQHVMARTAHQVPVLSASGFRAAFHDIPQTQPEQWSSESASVVANPGSVSQMPVTERERSWQQPPFSEQSSSDLPDLRGLMYPSTNPFAYGNQPLSVLEDAQMMAPEQQSSFTGPTSAFNVLASNPGPNNMPFDIFSEPPFGTAEQQTTYQHDRHEANPVPRDSPSYSKIPQCTMTHEMGALHSEENLWQQMDKGRTGLTPGVNLDDLFGSDGWWNPLYLNEGLARTQ